MTRSGRILWLMLVQVDGIAKATLSMRSLVDAEKRDEPLSGLVHSIDRAVDQVLALMGIVLNPKDLRPSGDGGNGSG